MEFVVIKEPFFGIFRKNKSWQLWAMRHSWGYIHEDWAEKNKDWIPVIDKNMLKMLNGLPTVSFCEASVALSEYVALSSRSCKPDEYARDHLERFSLGV
ncbi:MAG: hypothetical protein ABFC56_12425 [Clostridiaceae bacterium]